MTPLGWSAICRLGLVQAALGALVVLATSTMNRIMVVELSLPATLPGALVALHYLIQMLRPALGHGSDLGGRRTPWIIGGMAGLVCGVLGAAAALTLMPTNLPAGIALAVAAFALVGLGVGACGTALLALLAHAVAPARHAAAATVVWMMMIAGIAATAGAAGRLLDPFSLHRLLVVTALVGMVAMVTTLAAIRRLEPAPGPARPARAAARIPFRQALAQVWAEAEARRFTIFVFVSMFAYSAQELILEPFAGGVLHLPPGQSTGLTGLQHGGMLLGMVLVAVAGSAGRARLSPRVLTTGGCLASAAAVLAVASSGLAGPGCPLRPALFCLGVANGVFAVSAIGAMMGLARDNAGRTGHTPRNGLRMGLFGAAQAVAFASGGFAGAAASDLARALLGRPDLAYAAVFAGEALLFLVAAALAARLFGLFASPRSPTGVHILAGGG